MFTLQDAQDFIEFILDSTMAHDYVYRPLNNTCVYFTYALDGTPEEPSCIVGHLAYMLGHPNLVLEGNAASRTPLGDLFDEEARHYLNELQSGQDVGVPWGKAHGEATYVTSNAILAGIL